MRMSMRMSIVALLVASASCPIVGAAPTYTSQKIPGDRSGEKIVALNNATQALANRTGETTPVVYNWANGNVNDPGSHLPGLPAQDPSVRLTALAFNDTLQIVGYRQSADVNASFASSPKSAFVYSNGTTTYLGERPPFRQSGRSPVGDQSAATGTNNRGDVVGWWINDGSNINHAFLYNEGSVTDLGSLSPTGGAAATAINNVGQITGSSTAANPGTSSAFIYDQGVMSGALTFGQSSGGTDINDRGQMIGTIFFNQHSTLCFIDGVGMGGLGTNGSVGGNPVCSVKQINNAGIAIGTMYAGGTPSGGFVYVDGKMVTLNSLITPSDELALNHVDVDAVAINDKNEIVASGGGNYYLLTPTVTSTPDRAYYNFETDTQGWSSAGENIITVSTSTAQKFAGTSALAIQINNAGFALVRVRNPSAHAGQSITFHIYLPADAKIDWIQPSAQEGAAGNWRWHGKWQPIETLALGAWNTITLDIPADAQALDAIGLELYMSQPYAGTVYIDSIDFASPPADAAIYNFETNTQGWTSVGDDIVTVATSSAQKFAGVNALAVQINGGGFASVAVPMPTASAGQTITFHIYLPAGANLDWIQPFAQQGEAGGWHWNGNWQPLSTLQLGAWNAITVQVPSDAKPLDKIGVELYMSQPYSGTVYIDSVSF